MDDNPLELAALHTWWVGPHATPEFQASHRLLAAGSTLTTWPDLAAASRPAASSRDRPPDLIVLAQRWPGQYSASAVEALGRRWPLTRWLLVVGSWSEGETRSGHPLAGVPRIAWHLAPARLSDALARRGRGLCPEWALPPTMLDEDRLLARSSHEPGPAAGDVIVVADDEPAAQLLIDACRALGVCPTRAPLTECPISAQPRDAAAAADPSPSAARLTVLVDPSGQLAAAPERISELARRWPGARLLVCWPFPRAETIAALADCGASILPKPLLITDLESQLGRANA